MPNNSLIVGTVDYEAHRADVAEEVANRLAAKLSLRIDCDLCNFEYVCIPTETGKCADSLIKFTKKEVERSFETK